MFIEYYHSHSGAFCFSPSMKVHLCLLFNWLLACLMVCHDLPFFSIRVFSYNFREEMSVVQEQINLIILEPIPDDASECLQFSDET